MTPPATLNNLFSYDRPIAQQENEFIEFLVERAGIRLERIISHGQTTPPGNWYDQETDEWVVLLKGRASLEFGNGTSVHLTEGDYLMIPAGLRHRVSYTSKNPPCIWLALHLSKEPN